MMADNRTMEEMLQAPSEGYGDAIVVPDILAENFEIRTGLLSLIQANQIHGFESNNPHDHIRSFNRITSTLNFRDLSNDAIKLLLIPYPLEGAAKIWYETEPPRSILTWEDLTFGEAWERFKEMLRQCPHHGFLELHQIYTFYNGLNELEYDSLNATAGGNLMSKTPRDALTTIENKSKVCYSRNKSVTSKVSTTSSGSSSSTDARIDKLTDTISNLVETFNKKMTTPATVKAVKESCVICVGAHPYYDCIATDSNISSACAAMATNTTPKGRNRRSSKQKVENSNLEEHLPPVVTMADNRTMAELLHAPTERYAEAIVVPPILAEQLEIKHNLINMMNTDQFFGLEKDNPHDHIRWGSPPVARKRTPAFYYNAWDRYKDLLRACPHHGFTKLHQLDTFYNALNPADQDSLNAAACGNLLERITQQTSAVTIAITAMLKQFQATPPPAPVKAVEEMCVTCGGAHPYYQCLAAGGNTFPEFRDNIQ
nr:reverse transcriptase domain-containing protein [Tanacetum cinerariifolium]